MFLAPLLLAADLRLELVRHSLTGAHCRYRSYVQGLPTDDYVVKACGDGERALSLATPAATMRIVEGRVARRAIRDHVAYDYDAGTGELLRAVPLFFRGKTARVFDPNPVASLNDPSLRDSNDAATAVPEAAYRDVDLPDVAQEGPLRGPNVTLIDRQAPNVPPAEAGGSLRFNRADDGFEDVNAYFHIDRNQRYLQSLGYTGERSIAAYSIEVDAHAGGGSDNSFFLPSLTDVGRGTLSFGEGGTDDAEDADLLIHEYGHAILEWIAPGSFAGSFASQARALAEGFGDYWAFSQHVATRRGTGRDPYCFADWDARCAADDPSQGCGYAPGTDCLRRLDSVRTMDDYETVEQSGVEHRNGMIWSSALREIHEKVGKTVADTVILESIFDLPSLATYATAAHRLIEADRELYGGAHVSVICEAMVARRIASDCGYVPRGELVHVQSGDRGVTIPDNQAAGIVSALTVSDARLIDALYVQVDIRHPSRGDLRIELVAPDGTVVTLKQVSVEGGRDVRTTFGLTAATIQSLAVFRGRSAAGLWQLRVFDLRPHDTGTLVSWGLVVRFAESAARETRPRGAPAQMIPVVARVFGIGGTEFVSDVRIANPSTTEKTATLVFTPSGQDGWTNFAAIEVALHAGQTIAFDDVVRSAFLTAGSGTLEVLGDVVAMSRTYAMTENGTIGQQVPPNLEAIGAPDRLFAAPLLLDESSRVNLGVAEVGGGQGTVVVTDGHGATTLSMAPFSHAQFPVRNEPVAIEMRSGDAHIVSYLSQVNGATGDAMFIPATRLPLSARDVVAPVISAPGAGGSRWQSDVWFGMPNGAPGLADAEFFDDVRRDLVHRAFAPREAIADVIPTLFGRTQTRGAMGLTLPAGVLAFTRVRNGGMSEFIPWQTTDAPQEQELLFITSGSRYRTNIGIVATSSARADVLIYDSSGAELNRYTLAIDGGGSAQGPVFQRVTDGRAVVRFTFGVGRAYASIVDNGTGDATFIAGQ